MRETDLSDAITPFTLAIPQAQIDDLHRRLDNTRWPERETVQDWSQGAPLAKVQPLCEYWRHKYDWRRIEARLNAFGQFKTAIDGLDIHFLHVRSPHDNALPLLLTHGWPGSVIEFVKIIEPLTNPTKFGGKAEDAFHIVVPSLPGYGFSGKPTETGWGVRHIAQVWGKLMKRLGYQHWVAQGGDWGGAITSQIGAMKPEGCAGVHLNMTVIFPDADDLKDTTPQEQASLASMAFYNEKDSGYAKQQSTRPQTLGYGLTDSPAGQAAWIYEKLFAWTDNKGAPEDVFSMDEMLDNIMLYWLPATAASSGRLYWESLSGFTSVKIDMPVGVSIFPKEIFRPSRRWADKHLSNIIHWNELDAGGHFAAWEKPEVFIDEVRTCFRALR
jgi:pimeloyl-ACP methyl ester carboxylesterase